MRKIIGRSKVTGLLSLLLFLCALGGCWGFGAQTATPPLDPAMKEMLKLTMMPRTASDNLPELPRVYLDTTYVAPSSTPKFVAAGDNLQAALDAARPGDVLALQAGATWTGNFTLRAKSGSGWIIIRSSAPDSSLPPPGTRISPSFASVMPKLISPNSLPALQTDNGAHHYRFIGVEFGVAPGRSVFNLILLSVNLTSIEQVPHNLIFDRCYIHGNPNEASRRGIALNSASTAVIDSYISEFKDPNNDAQAICGWQGPGPFKIVNNFLEASAENILMGGSDPTIQNLVPSDIEFRRNYVAKPLKWKANDPNYAGFDWVTKNLLELKNAQRMLIDRNIFEYNWEEDQRGAAIVFTPRNQDNTAPWSVVQDITFTNNIVRHTADGLFITGFDGIYGSQITRRILIRNNLFDDVNGRWTSFPDSSARGEFALIVSGAEDVYIDHNTVIQSGNILTSDDPDKPNRGFIFNNNIVAHNTYGILGAGIGFGEKALMAFFPGYTFLKNVIVGPESKDFTFPPNNFFPESYNQVGFVNFSAQNYRLAPSSAYRNAATDGTDIGCNLDELLSFASAASIHAASYRDNALAPETITAAFGSDLASTTVPATVLPLPITLGGTNVTVRDSSGVDRQAPLFFVSPAQVNYLIPKEASLGTAIITITNSRGTTAVGRTNIERVAPGLFTADASGRGVPAGVALRISNNTASFEPIAFFDPAQSKFTSVPIDLGPQDDQVFVILFGTGMRNRTNLSEVAATIGGDSAQVSYLGPQNTFEGLDQANILLPRSLLGRGEVDLLLTVDGKEANGVRVNVK